MQTLTTNDQNILYIYSNDNQRMCQSFLKKINTLHLKSWLFAPLNLKIWASNWSVPMYGPRALTSNVKFTSFRPHFIISYHVSPPGYWKTSQKMDSKRPLPKSFNFLCPHLSVLWSHFSKRTVILSKDYLKFLLKCFGSFSRHKHRPWCIVPYMKGSFAILLSLLCYPGKPLNSTS